MWWGPLLGVIVGFVLSQLTQLIQRKRSLKHYREALYAEINLCEEWDVGYIEQEIDRLRLKCNHLVRDSW